MQQQGYEIDLLNIGRDGRIDLEQLEELLRKDTVLVSICGVDSELGTVQPVREIAALVHRCPNCRLHVDATQAVGKTALWLDCVDAMSFTAHKFYGPNGIGVLYKRKGLVIEPQMNGGASHYHLPQRHPHPGPCRGFAGGAGPCADEQPQRCAHVQALHDTLCAELQKRPGVRINSPAGAVPHIVNVSVAGIKAGVFQQALSGQGVCVSVKSACSTDGTPSKAVFAVSRDRKMRSAHGASA